MRQRNGNQNDESGKGQDGFIDIHEGLPMFDAAFARVALQVSRYPKSFILGNTN
jgi:hypothetical protein